jgi:hypothetical protein
VQRLLSVNVRSCGAFNSAAFWPVAQVRAKVAATIKELSQLHTPN